MGGGERGGRVEAAFLGGTTVDFRGDVSPIVGPSQQDSSRYSCPSNAIRDIFTANRGPHRQILNDVQVSCRVKKISRVFADATDSGVILKQTEQTTLFLLLPLLLPLFPPRPCLGVGFLLFPRGVHTTVMMAMKP